MGLSVSSGGHRCPGHRCPLRTWARGHGEAHVLWSVRGNVTWRVSPWPCPGRPSGSPNCPALNSSHLQLTEGGAAVTHCCSLNTAQWIVAPPKTRTHARASGSRLDCQPSDVHFRLNGPRHVTVGVLSWCLLAVERGTRGSFPCAAKQQAVPADETATAQHRLNARAVTWATG